ncbi:hypothetical protein LTR08_006765 [Meristemomyces frigidus]|nr:hypothetical protein LTR08_006765 [Meristemomyces frigidus]
MVCFGAFGLAQLLLFYLPAVQCVVNIDDYFNVKTGNEDVGGCDEIYEGKTGHEWLQTWFQEAQTLTDTASNAIKGYGTEELSRKNLAVFMGIEPKGGTGNAPSNPKNLGVVEANFQKTQQWLATAPAQKKWIFCSAKWLVEKKPDDLLEVTHGSSSGFSSSSGPQAKIKDVYSIPSGQKPYWSKDLQEYLIERPMNAKNFCNRNFKNFGGTMEWFGTLGATEPTQNTALTEVMSKGVTLYHELFHFILGSVETPDIISNLRGVISTSASDAINGEVKSAWLPESLATFAEAQWLSVNQWPGIASNQYWGWDGAGNAQQKAR